MKERSHSLISFSTYLNKGFHLRRHAAQMSDARTDPDISPASVFLALLHAFVFRLPSFQQLDAELGHSYLQQWIGAERSFRDGSSFWLRTFIPADFDFDRLLVRCDRSDHLQPDHRRRKQ